MILPREFYARSAIEVARELLGKLLVHRSSYPASETSGIIVETEAYLGQDDLAAHSAAGITERTRVIFGPPGHAYVYLSYGMHECLNVVAEPDGVPGCVLIRALQPVSGLEVMRARRPAARSDRELTNGPGKLTRAMGISRIHYGADLTSGDLVILNAPSSGAPVEIDVTPRIGITKCADLPLRFVVHGTRFASGR